MAGIVEVEQAIVTLVNFFLELWKFVQVADERLLNLVHQLANIVVPLVLDTVRLLVELRLLWPRGFVCLAKSVVEILARLLRLL